MPLDRTNTVLEIISTQCPPNTLGPAIDSFLAQYVAVVFYSEMEEKVSEIIQKKLSAHSNTTIAAFLHSSMEGMIKRTPKSDIANLVARFDQSFKDAFNARIPDTTVTRYMNVITARHQTGHGKGASVSLEEIKRGLAAANEILEALDVCIPNPPGDLSVT